jgi:hypothetical protein
MYLSAGRSSALQVKFQTYTLVPVLSTRGSKNRWYGGSELRVGRPLLQSSVANWSGSLCAIKRANTPHRFTLIIWRDIVTPASLAEQFDSKKTPFFLFSNPLKKMAGVCNIHLNIQLPHNFIVSS